MPVTLSQKLAENHYPIAQDGEAVSGPGADFLQEIAAGVDFFLQGEPHGVKDNLVLANWLFDRVARAGPARYVTEVGPISAAVLNRFAGEASAEQFFAGFYAAYPVAIPFAYFKKEIALLHAAAVQKGAGRPPIIGIDQEFMVAPQLLLEDLLAMCEDPSLAAEIRGWLAAEKAAVQEMAGGVPPDQVRFFMNQDLPSRWADLRAGAASSGRQDFAALVSALEASWEIYNHYQAGRYYLNNHARGELMKRYFLQAYHEERGARYFIKLGSNHAARGFSIMNILDIGNFVSELAVLEGKQSFHLLVLPLSGFVNGWFPFLPPETRSVQLDPQHNDRYYRSLIENAPEKNGWNLYDLRPLRGRAHLWEPGDPWLKDAILSYDAVLMMSDVRAASLVHPE